MITKLECEQQFYDNGQIRSMQIQNLKGQRHFPHGIAVKYWYRNGQIASEAYYINDKLHNPNGIAFKSWFANGQIQSKEYYINAISLTKEEFDKIQGGGC